MNGWSDNARGAILMVVGMCAFTANDAFMKALSDELPLFQAIFCRGLGMIALLALICAAKGQLRVRMARGDWGWLALRTAGEVGGTFFFLTALFAMPLANVTAILQVLPLSVSLAAAVFLRQPLGWPRLLAIMMGFAGVILIVQPGGEGFNIYSLSVLAAVVCATTRDIAMRRMSSDVPSLFVGLIAACGVTALGGLGAATATWVPISTTAAWQLGGSMLFLIAGYLGVIGATRTGDIAFTAPFRYSALLVALVLGVVIFDDWPNGLAMTGGAIVVGTGLFTLYRETRHSARPKNTPSISR